MTLTRVPFVCHSALGQVFTWGFGFFGEGGTDDSQLNVNAVVVENLRKIISTHVTCGARHTIVCGSLEAKPKKGWPVSGVCVVVNTSQCALFVAECRRKSCAKGSAQNLCHEAYAVFCMQFPPSPLRGGGAGQWFTCDVLRLLPFPTTAPSQCALWVGVPYTEAASQLKMRFSCAPCKLDTVCRACARTCHKCVSGVVWVWCRWGVADHCTPQESSCHHAFANGGRGVSVWQSR